MFARLEHTKCGMKNCLLIQLGFQNRATRLYLERLATRRDSATRPTLTISGPGERAFPPCTRHRCAAHVQGHAVGLLWPARPPHPTPEHGREPLLRVARGVKPQL